MNRIALWLACASFFALVTSCGSTSSEAASDARCGHCGMTVDPESEWRTGGTDAAGAELQFDSPKCLFRYHQTHGAVSDAWVTEHYAQERADASSLLFVAGTDLHSGMGRDLVPVRGAEAAERLRVDHHGTAVYSFDQVTAEVIDPLFEADE